MVVSELIENVVDIPGLFGDIAAHDPASAVLLALGSIILFVSLGFFTFLTIGAILELVMPEKVGATHP